MNLISYVSAFESIRCFLKQNQLVMLSCVFVYFQALFCFVFLSKHLLKCYRTFHFVCVLFIYFFIKKKNKQRGRKLDKCTGPVLKRLFSRKLFCSIFPPPKKKIDRFEY